MNLPPRRSQQRTPRVVNKALEYAMRDVATLDLAIFHARKRTCAVQAGGNYGVFPKHLATEFNVVYTFEPDPQNFDFMCHNLAGRHNIIKLQAAVGYERGLVKTESTRRDGSTKPPHGGLAHVAGPGIIPILRIDDLALPACDLLVLDLEGFELFALIGARETIKHHRPVIMCEIGKHSAHYDITEEDVRTAIRMEGYTHFARVHADEIWLPVEAAQSAAA